MDSMLCTKKAMVTSEFRNWTELMRKEYGMHRKLWEWCFISQSLREHGVLNNGKTGLGFGVGTEPLTSLFASFGTSILATDLETEKAAAAGWLENSEHSDNKNMLNMNGICEEKQFQNLVRFEYCNMNDIPERYNDSFDFLWSSCSLEHLGSIELGTQFIFNSINCLKPGGIAVHTTEFNVSSNLDTIETGPTVLFRRKDIENIIKEVNIRGCFARMNWDCGEYPEDYHVDIPPYSHNPHLKLRMSEYTITSIGLVIIK